ncbi:ferritin-like domain-containing protein [Salinisphaera hydrothermalis]|uniref:YciE/YciF ferroxidase family protein n=1 Tax=Salinisphaera hydrothermalis TaxID=563188 RepID=UPI00333F0428
MPSTTLKNLYVASLQKMYTGENKILDALPGMIETTENAGLQQAFQNHRDETADHVKRLEDLLNGVNADLGDAEARGIAGLIAEGEDTIGSNASIEVKEAAMVAVAQQIEHLEIAAYGTLCTYAEMLGRGEDFNQLQQTLDEERHADSKLNELAKEIINGQARGD